MWNVCVSVHMFYWQMKNFHCDLNNSTEKLVPTNFNVCDFAIFLFLFSTRICRRRRSCNQQSSVSEHQLNNLQPIDGEVEIFTCFYPQRIEFWIENEVEKIGVKSYNWHWQQIMNNHLHIDDHCNTRRLYKQTKESNLKWKYPEESSAQRRNKKKDPAKRARKNEANEGNDDSFT